MGDKRWKPNVTVAAVIEQEGRYLLVEEMTSRGLRLNLPAGHLEAGESLLEGVVREVLEETMRPFEPQALVSIQMGRLLPRGDEDITFLRFAFTGTVQAPWPGRVYDSPVVANHWLSWDELEACQARHRSHFVRESVQLYREGHRHSLSLLHTDPSVYAVGPAGG
ncbi:NUDIX domain-containing protein [Ideonella sp. B508-1]|uniref:NUDIX domain-containing protein n=1 Tax=Ideonella sp. B508-1 TaxID=137716 RepID=UPI0003B3097F|nr:NUDIX domain-containing protein [Ideonella sp. B508-1]